MYIPPLGSIFNEHQKEYKMARPGRPNKSDPRADEITIDIEKGVNGKSKRLLSEAPLVLTLLTVICGLH